MSTILDHNLNIVSGLINCVSSIVNTKSFLTTENPSGYGTFTFNGNTNISGNITTTNIYCENTNINQSLSKLIQITDNLSGAH